METITGTVTINNNSLEIKGEIFPKNNILTGTIATQSLSGAIISKITLCGNIMETTSKNMSTI